jgi:hypothetical protein
MGSNEAKHAARPALKTACSPKLKPVTDRAVKSAARATEAAELPLNVLKVESNDDVLNVTS